MPQIIIDIAPDGSTKVSASGFHGSSCTDATRAIRAALGEQTSENRTPEFYQDSDQTGQNRAFQG